MQPGIGRGTCLFIGLFSIQRVLVDAVLRTPEPLFLGLLCLIAALYLLAPFMPQRAGDRATESSALGGGSLS